MSDRQATGTPISALFDATDRIATLEQQMQSLVRNVASLSVTVQQLHVLSSTQMIAIQAMHKRIEHLEAERKGSRQ